MMRSLFSAVAGLRTHQTKMDVIGNNIANVNTYGFKSSRTTFADVYYQSLSNGNSASNGLGGTNPTQIGYGSAIATIDIMNTQSGAASTDRAMDVYIQGDGFLVVHDANGNPQYTRLGNLGFDADGNLVDGNGHFVQGFPLKADGTPNISADGTITGSETVGINVSPELLDKLTGISISSTGAIIGLLPGEKKFTPATVTPAFINRNTASIPNDSNYTGAVQVAAGGYIPASDFGNAFGASCNVTKVEFGDKALMASGTYDLSGANGIYTLKNTGTNVEYNGTFDANTGKINFANSSGKTVLSVSLDSTPDTNITTKPGIVVEDYVQATTTDDGSNKQVWPVGGVPMKLTGAGTITNLIPGMTLAITEADFDKTSPFIGSIGKAELSEGEKVNIGNLVIAKFRNAAGLTQAGTSYFEETFNSGEATYVLPGLQGTGSLKAGYLEMSNVDMSKEFTDMITTQRGFQANSRIITVSDEMLQELVNLKR